MQQIKINGNLISFPTEAKDLTLKQFFGLRESKDLIDEVSVLSGIPRESILQFKNLQTIEAARTLTGMITESLKAGFEGVVLPKEVVIGGKKVKVPKELRLQPIGAFMNVNDLLATHYNANHGKGEINYTDCIPKTLAHYFYQPYFGDSVPYSETKAESEGYMELIMAFPFVEAVPIANFFFRRFPNLI